MSSTKYVGEVLSTFADIFQPLEDSLATGQSFSAFLADFGWSLDPASGANVTATALGSLPSLLNSIRGAVTALESSNTGGKAADIEDSVAKLTLAIKDLVSAIRSLSSATPNSAWPPPLNTTIFWETFPLELLEDLLYRYLQSHAPKIFSPLRLIGVLSADYAVPLTTYRVAYMQRRVRWDRLVTAITEPHNILVNVYGWGGAFEVYRLLENLRGVALTFDLMAVLRDASHPLLDAYYDQTAPSRKEALELSVPLHWEVSEIGGALGMLMVELAALPIPPADNKSVAAVGLAVYPR